MRIRNHIFISVLIATMLPTLLLALGASYYSEYNFKQKIKNEVITSLNSLTSEINRELLNNRSLVLGISRANAIRDFYPVLISAKNNKFIASVPLLRRKLTRYFEGFQTILTSAFTMRILDTRGDTLVKVSHNKTSQAQYESLYGINYVEHQVSTPAFIEILDKLVANEINFVTLPHHSLENENTVLSLLDYAVPLFDEETRVGTLVVTISGEQIDHILDNQAMLYKGELTIVENNPDNSQRHGLLLNDKQLRFQNLINRKTFSSASAEMKRVFEAVINNTEGEIELDNSFIFYTEFFPYPNRLIGWILTTRISKDILLAPYSEIRMAIWLIVSAVLLITLLISTLAVRKISGPVVKLASQLKTFADGNVEQRSETKQSIDEIKTLSSSFNYMADTLVNARKERDRAQNMMLQNDKLSSIGQMAAGIGHEINNPLNNILSYSKLISRNISKNAADLNPASLQNLQQDIDALRSETLRASEIIKGILNFARQMPPNPEEFNIKWWLQRSIDLVQQTAKSKGIEIVLNYESDDSIRADQLQLQQVIINLLLNAIQASDVHATISIDVSVSDDRLRIEITDQGSGIDEEIKDRIFDPFFTTKGEGEGSGLGLSISLGIIESHNGQLELLNRKEIDQQQGSIARIILPI